MNKNFIFDDLLNIRIGTDKNFLSGAGNSEIKKLTTIEEWNRKSTALKELFMQTTGIIPDNIDYPLSPEIISEEKYTGYIKRKITFNVQRNERIDAYMLLPDNIPNKCPAVLCLPPTTPLGKEQTIGNGTTAGDADRAYALHLVKLGFITFTFDWDSSGTRQYPGREPFDNAPFYHKYPAWSAVGKNIWDIKKAIDLLESFEEVDDSRIASIGHSQGGGATIYAMAMDNRIKIGISSCGGFPLRMDKNPYHDARDKWWIGRPALRPYCLTGKEFPCDLHELLALCAPRPFLYIAALNDCHFNSNEIHIVNIALENMQKNIKNIYTLYNADNNFEVITHTNGHSFIKQQREIAYKKLSEYLK